ncbi:Fe(3+) ABC transporter substrate-binding protein [Oricola thermophila]|uniref:Fe(3+) ABC transporter substrate-binding protein n=1 Tax=Oricola thermophila TaxID=2742145 RepID=A0A6N1V8W3_9HYPH|nr:Fe(3+) ABC transporter substrate-binding protein [Oricola thermophila]QKV17431.1 Fe(3+) ABC transporter substrate-binding protein [Oricola thermophila]
MKPRLSIFALLLATSAAFAGSAIAAEEVNLYSSRHYDTDEKLYSDFEELTGIRINRIEGNADELIERLKAEGRNSPADVLLTVDAGRIWRAADADLLTPVESEILEERIPAELQHPDNLWFGFSTRARLIFYAKDRVNEPPQTYAELADPKYKGKICIRSGSNIYNLSLLASRIAEYGPEAAEEWAAGLKANLAREPQGGDTDQLRGLVSGECDIAVANSYYFARALRTEVEGLSDHADGIGWIFPDQDGNGTHVNVSAAGVLANAPNRENAIKFLEYLASDSAQEYFASGNDEYPVVEDVGLSASVTKLGEFKRDDLNLSALGEFQAEAQAIFNAVGFK